MDLIACSIYDQKTEAYMRPFYAITKGEAIRIFTDTTNDENSMLHKHPDDYTLYTIGVFDDATGSLESVPHENLGLALSYLEGAVAPSPPKRKRK